MDTWSYRDSTWVQAGDLVGYEVEATDGSMGNVDDATDDISGSYLVVDVGFWILGRQRLIPAGAVTGVDHDSKTVTVSMTKDQVKDAPDYDDATWGAESRTAHEDYYHPFSQ
jgi:hypothetical protein